MATLAIVTAVLPIGMVITALSQEVLHTAIAAQDVLVDQESFKRLSKYLGEINGVLGELQRRNLSDTPAVRFALENMRTRVTVAQGAIQHSKGKSRIYLLLHCRAIVKSAQVVTRGIGEALQLLIAAGAETQMDIGEHAHRLKEHMVKAEFHACQAQSQVMSKIESAIHANKTDQGFANDLLRDIALAVGVSTERAELRSELASFQKEMEELALQKKDQEKAFMEQVIAILYRAEAVSPPENSNSKYKRLAQRADRAEGSYPPFPSFICPLTEEVMVDPVLLANPRHTDFTYERSAIVDWLQQQQENGDPQTDPRSGIALANIELRPNNRLRESIQEWAALNDVIQIRSAKEGFLSREEKQQTCALEKLRGLCEKGEEYKDWIGNEGVLESMVEFLASSRSELMHVRELSLDALLLLVTDNDPNKERFAKAGGLKPTMIFLNKKHYRSKSAALLKELSKSSTVCDQIPGIVGAISSLATLYFQNESDSDVGDNLRFILDKLSEKDLNVMAMAKANWWAPLIKQLSSGSDSSKLCMANYIANASLSNICGDSKMLTGEGVIPPLVKMCKSGRIDAKMAALGGLSNLCSCNAIKSFVAAAGAIPVVIDLQVSLMYPLELRERAASILANLSSGNGIKYFWDSQNGFLPLYKAVEPFLHFQALSSTVMRLHILRALLGMAQETEGRFLIRMGKGIPVLLSLVSSSNCQTRDSALRLLYNLSEENEGALEIADEVHRRKQAQDLVRLLGENLDPYTQAATAGILTNHPPNHPKFKNSLLAAGVISALVILARSTHDEVQENAVGALRHFTEPSDIQAQRSAAHLDTLPLLVQLLETGSHLTKARAAQVLRNFSLNTPRLVAEDEPTGCTCLLRPLNSLCRVHKGKCSVKGTFCLVETGAVDPLVSLLDMVDTEAAEAGVEALETLLVSGDEVNQTGAVLLHERQGIRPLLHLLTRGSSQCTDRAVQLLEFIFKDPKIKQLYAQSAQMPLARLIGQSHSSPCRKKAERLLAKMIGGALAYQ